MVHIYLYRKRPDLNPKLDIYSTYIYIYICMYMSMYLSISLSLSRSLSLLLNLHIPFDLSNNARFGWLGLSCALPLGFRVRVQGYIAPF